MTDFKKIRRSPQYSKLRSIDLAVVNKKSVAWLNKVLAEKRGQPNVVVTHHGPSLLSVPEHLRNEASTAAYVSDLTEIIKTHSPKYWVHGHLHCSSNYKVGNCTVLCNPKGYPDELNKEFEEDFCFEI